MGINPKKYIVFNRADFIAATEAGHQWEPNEIEDAVVIRKRDSFAAGAFYSYASSIHAALAVAEDSGTTVDYLSLEEIADHFAGLADESRQMFISRNSKIPTP